MTKDEEHLHDVLPFFFFLNTLMIASVLIHFVSCVNHFPVSVSRDLTFSVSLGLRIIQLFDLAYRLAESPLRGM